MFICIKVVQILFHSFDMCHDAKITITVLETVTLWTTVLNVF